MINEIVFSRDYSSLWRTLTPTMEGFVRRLNGGLYDDDFAPLASIIDPRRRAFANEVAFMAWCEIVDVKNTRMDPTSVSSLLQKASRMVADEAVSLRRQGNFDVKLSRHESLDIAEQISRLQKKLESYNAKSVITRPRFAGCGVVFSCNGDVMVDGVLVEIKAGDRPFRSADIRQALTYLSLNHANRLYDIESIAFWNPRTGKSFVADVEDICFQVSGKDSTGLLGNLVYALTDSSILQS